jgi:hypothetical protein
LHGFPKATELSGIDFVTTLPAPITQLFPTFTPGRIIVPPPIHTLSPIVTGRAAVTRYSFPFSPFLNLSLTFIG